MCLMSSKWFFLAFVIFNSEIINTMYLFLTLNIGLPVDIFTHRASTFSKIYIKKIKINFEYLRRLWGLDSPLGLSS